MAEKKSVFKKLFSKPNQDCCNVEIEEKKSTENESCCGSTKENNEVQQKYSGLVERFNENVNDYNELLEENKSLKSKISDLKRDVSLIYESTKEFLKERTDGLKAFKNVFKGFVDKVKDKTAQFQEKHDL